MYLKIGNKTKNKKKHLFSSCSQQLDHSRKRKRVIIYQISVKKAEKAK